MPGQPFSQWVRSQKWLLTILFVALVARVVSYGPLHSDRYTSDEREYLYLAHKVANGEQLIDSNGDTSKRSPLYPVVLGNLFKVFGDPLWLPHVVGCILGTLIVLLAYLLSVTLWSDRSLALVTAGAVSIYPGLVIYAGMLQTETLYMVFFLLAFTFSYRLIQKPTVTAAVVLGVVSGLAALTRAVYGVFFPILLFLILWLKRKEATRVWPVFVLALVVFCLVLLPWTARNYAIHRTVIPVSSWGTQFLIGNNPFATGTWRLNEGYQRWCADRASQFGVADMSTLTEVAIDRLSISIAFDYITSHPADALMLVLKKAFIFWVYPITNSDSNLPLEATATGSDFILYIGMSIGFVATWKERHHLWPLYSAFALFALAQVVLHSEARFRLPLVPLLCLFFGWGAAVVTDRQRWMEFAVCRTQMIAAAILVTFVVMVYTLTGWLFLAGKI